MTRKHFVSLANALKPLVLAAKTAKEKAAAREWVEAVANACAEMNERFNKATFFSACGLSL